MGGAIAMMNRTACSSGFPPDRAYAPTIARGSPIGHFSITHGTAMAGGASSTSRQGPCAAWCLAEIRAIDP